MKKCGIFVLVFAMIVGVFAQVTFASEKGEAFKLSPEYAGKKNGIIFNVDDILLDIESYQGGIGVKHYFNEKFAYRGSIDFSYIDSSSSLTLNLGNSIEKHLLTGRVSPYIGAFLDIGYIHFKSTDEASGVETEVTSIPLSIGPLIGVEVFVLDFVSLFAEYSLSASYSKTKTEQTAAGVTTSDKDSDFSIEAGIGNESKIGIVVYFNTLKKRK